MNTEQTSENIFTFTLVNARGTVPSKVFLTYLMVFYFKKSSNFRTLVSLNRLSVDVSGGLKLIVLIAFSCSWATFLIKAVF